jgi:hypothetical protein
MAPAAVVRGVRVWCTTRRRLRHVVGIRPTRLLDGPLAAVAASAVAQSDNLPGTLAIDDFERRQSAGTGIDVQLLRLVDDVVMTLERDLDDVVLGIVDDARERQPLRFDLWLPRASDATSISARLPIRA